MKYLKTFESHITPETVLETKEDKKYKVEIYPDSKGHTQRDKMSKELEFNTLSELKKWVKSNCDLRHNVLTKAEYLTQHIEDLNKKGKCEFSYNNNAIVMVFDNKKAK